MSRRTDQQRDTQRRLRLAIADGLRDARQLGLTKFDDVATSIIVKLRAAGVRLIVTRKED